jgi:hypothetical protein
MQRLPGVALANDNIEFTRPLPLTILTLFPAYLLV